MDERKINDSAAGNQRDHLMPSAGVTDEFAEQRSRIEMMLADPSRSTLKDAEIRKLAEDLKERMPEERRAEFGSFFRGIEDRFSNEGPSTGDTGTPSALDTSETVTSNRTSGGGGRIL